MLTAVNQAPDVVRQVEQDGLEERDPLVVGVVLFFLVGWVAQAGVRHFRALVTVPEDRDGEGARDPAVHVERCRVDGALGHALDRVTWTNEIRRKSGFFKTSFFIDERGTLSWTMDTNMEQFHASFG